jgi:hypothetical protein
VAGAAAGDGSKELSGKAVTEAENGQLEQKQDGADDAVSLNRWFELAG